MAYNRITVNPNQMSGEPCIRNTRIPVATILSMLAQELSIDTILEYYPDLEKEDIIEALRFAAEAINEKELPLTRAS
jgi:uncharacterized protein (DUF433 family)